MRKLRRFIHRNGRRLGVAGSACMIIAAAAKIGSGELTYINYRGAVVFVPFVIVVGLVLLCVLVFRYDRLGAARVDGNRRKARQATFTRSRGRP